MEPGKYTRGREEEFRLRGRLTRNTKCNRTTSNC